MFYKIIRWITWFEREKEFEVLKWMKMWNEIFDWFEKL
jgi:hypothetical protein